MIEKLKIKCGVFLRLSVACMLGLLVSGGCVSWSSAWYVTVENCGETVIQDVCVSVGNGIHEFGVIDPHAVARGQRMASSPDENSLLKWRVADGSLKSIKLKSELTEGGGKVLHYVVGKDGVARVFVIENVDKSTSDMPWSTPASWEGAPTIPGLSTQR